MSSHVVVLDSSARRATIKTSPGTYLSELLQQACTKLGLDASQYGLRNNNKSLDLSRTFRLSGLPSGAKLELVQLSRSPSVVSVALQLPESEALGTSGNRLTDKFPSTTTLWLILRKFESGAAGGLGHTRNFTARAIPRGGEGGSGSGRLYHESPVLQIMGRDLVSFEDLQKTLGQLGFNSGTALLRLSFRASDVPLEQAKELIGQYFASTEGENKSSESNTGSEIDRSNPSNDLSVQSVPETERDKEPEISPHALHNPPVNESIRTPHNPPVNETLQAPLSQPVNEPLLTPPNPPSNESLQAPLSQPVNEPLLTPPNPPSNESLPTPPTPTPIIHQPPTSAPMLGPEERAISVFAPPQSSTPHASRQVFNEADYEPTLDHARFHQARLAQSSRNRRLLTDAEVASREESQRQKTASVKEVEIKIRFPDQTQVVSKFSDTDTGSSLYSFVQGLLNHEDEAFLLNFTAPHGPVTVPNDPEIKLIGGRLAMAGKVLVNFLWDENASVDARGAPVLKVEWSSQAKDIPIPEIPEQVPLREDLSAARDSSLITPFGPNEGKAKGGKVPKWLKLGGKK